MIYLVIRDNESRRIVSKHRTYVAAVQADRKLQRMIRRNNGENSYLRTSYETPEGGRYCPTEYEQHGSYESYP